MDYSGTTDSAIACFKQLKLLKIQKCDKLTEICVINGISKCKTLEQVGIKDCENLKEALFPRVP